MSRYLITGGAGFIGSNLALRLVAEGEKVTIYDDFSTGHRENLEEIRTHRDVRIVEADIRDLKELKKEARKCDLILHQAAQASIPQSMKDPLACHDVNVLGTLNVLLAAQAYTSVKRVVVASSCAVYGDSPTLPKTETMQNHPLSPYAVASIAAEDYARMFYNSFKVDTVCLRYFNVFGPRQDSQSAVVPRFISALLRGRPPVIYGDGKQSRDFTYVDNVVEANLLAARTPKAGGEVLNIACGSRMTILGLANILGAVLEKVVNPKFEPARSGDCRHSLADITRAQDILGYRPRPEIEDCLRETVEWFRRR